MLDYIPCVCLHIDLSQAKILRKALDHESRLVHKYNGVKVNEDGSKEPICTEDYKACEELMGILDAWIAEQENREVDHEPVPEKVLNHTHRGSGV